MAEAHGHQGVPGEEKPAVSVEPSLMRAVDEAALYRIARRRRRDRFQRDERITVRFSQAEDAAIRARARSLNIAVAHLIGDLTMAHIAGEIALPGHRTVIDDYIDELNALRTQVARIGNNVNQIARVLNSGGHPHPVDTAVLAHAERTLNAVRDTVAAIDAASRRAATVKPTA